MTHEELVERVAGHAGVDHAEAERALRVVLAVLANVLGRVEAEALADDLPPASGEPLRGRRFVRGLQRDEVVRRVAHRLHRESGMAVELVTSALRALAEAVRPATRARLAKVLPPGLRDSFTVAPPVELPPRVHPGHRLADGRPGSRRPLAEARPREAQRHSVVRADNPHADTKLSSAAGLTQERERASLATGVVGSRRPVGTSRE